jgi:hypothetical protein
LGRVRIVHAAAIYRAMNGSDGLARARAEPSGGDMKTKTKIWLGVGAFVMAGTGAMTQSAPARSLLESSALTGSDAATRGSSGVVLAQHRHGGEGGERAGSQKGAKAKKGGGEGGEGEGGERGGSAKLAPDLDFALRIAQMRGHLLVGDELVKEGQWNAAYPHFRHPTEELYGPIRGRLKDYKTPPFDAALKVLANVVKSKKGGDDYDRAMRAVDDALATADRALKDKQVSWDSFTVETALEVLKSATGEYEEAIVKGRIAKPVEYQDARGFVWQAERMIRAVAPALESKDADALRQVREVLASLKKTWPAAMPPKVPVKDYGSVLGDVSRIELAAGRLM